MSTVRRVLLAVLLILCVCRAARAQDTTPNCGGAWQLPCYDWSDCAWRLFGVWCVGGWVPKAPWNGCDSSRFNSAGLCIPCGGTLEGMCWNPPLCDEWHNNVMGVCVGCGGLGEGICWSGPMCKTGLAPNAWGFCYGPPPSEPTTNVTGLPSPVQAGTDPVRGIADVHNHQFANLGFGGVIFSGKPYDERGIGAALAPCDYTWDFTTKTSVLGIPLLLPLVGWEVHGPQNLQATTAPVSFFDREGAHDPSGAGAFGGWPKYSTMTHQQMYYKWLERAYQGGLRLMVMHAISSEAICRATKLRDNWTCDDMEAVDRQLVAAKELERAIDRMDDGVENGSGWYRIVTSPTEARAVIRSGKMAVVLGIEVDSLFGCKKGNAACTLDYVRGQLKKYRDLGVRHIYPIHHYDNAFGGSAVFLNMLNTGNALISGDHFEARDCSSDGYTFKLKLDPFAILGVALGVVPPNYEQRYPGVADCNLRGLAEPFGAAVINEMMRQKFIIDVDHMSRLMLDSVLQIADNRSPKYPLVSGHTNFLSRLTPPLQDKMEMSLTDDQLATMKRIGGIVTVSTIPPDCGTSKGFAAKYEYAIDKMQGGPFNRTAEQMPDGKAETGFDGVALGTDFNGWGGQIQPRFGLPNCPAPDAPPLTYPFEGPLFKGTFDRQQTGARQFDFNTDGLAHVGLLPDLIADAKLGGLTDARLNVLYNSAETFIRMWEQIDGIVIEPHVVGTLSDSGWYRSDVQLTWSVTTSDPVHDPVTATSGCGAQTITTDTAGVTFTCTASVGDGASPVTASRSVTIRRDATPPVASAQAKVAGTAYTPGTWTRDTIAVHFEATDATSGITGAAQADVVHAADGANQEVSYTFKDLAGNTAVAKVSGLNIDRTPPQIRFKFADLPAGASDDQHAAEVLAWHNHDVQLIVEAVDPLSGVAQGSPSPALVIVTAEGGNAQVTATATDNVGNTSTVTSGKVKIDKTPPTITFATRTPAANQNGWNNSDVTVTWACADALAGPAAPSVVTTVSAEGAAVTATGTCADLAGNTKSASVSDIKIDHTPPAIQFAFADPQEALHAWHNHDVPLSVTASDALSGVAPGSPAPALLVLSIEGAAVHGPATATDLAGNAATATSFDVRIDKTPPVISFATRIPAANEYGWNNSDVTVSWACADGLSGPVTPSVVTTITAEGAAMKADGTCVDRAGNTASASVPGINIDKTAPVVTCPATPPSLWPPNHALVPVTVGLVINGGPSGAGAHVLTGVRSNEADNGLGDGDTPGDIVGFLPGGAALIGALRAERSALGSGRIYTLTYTGSDRAGNSAGCTTQVQVPLNQGAGKK